MYRYSSRRLEQESTGFKILKYGEPKQILFNEINGMDVYNSSAPIMFNGRAIIAARVEPRGNHDSKVVLFEKEDISGWYPVPEWTAIPLEDPFFFEYCGDVLLGGVETFRLSDDGVLGWRTVLFRLSGDFSVEKIFSGPNGMKDLRFIEFPDGGIGVFTRPQGGIAGRGTCGYMEADSLSNLTAEDISAAPLISRPDENSWEGVNQPLILDDDRIGLLGHIAWMEEGDVRHYYAAVSVFYRSRREKTGWKIIIKRSELPSGPSKREDLADVLFPGGLAVLSEKEAIIYLGVSDVQAWEWKIQNPFGINL